MADDEAGVGGGAPRRKAVAAARKSETRKAGPDAAPPAKAAARKAPAPRAPAVIKAGPAKATRKAQAAGIPKKASAGKAATRRTGATPPSEPVPGAAPRPRFAGSRLAAERTFADDPAPPPSPAAGDPSNRVRDLLRSAAAGIREQEAVAGSRSVYDTGYPSAPAPVRPVWPSATAAPMAPVPSADLDPDPPRDVAPPVRAESPESPIESPIEPGPEPAEPTSEVLIAPRRRRLLRPPPPEPTPEPEWSAGDQPLEDEPVPDRIPDALDVLSVPAAEAPKGSRTAVRRFPPPSPASASTVTTPPPPPKEDATATQVIEPPPWTPPPPKADKAKRDRSGGSGRSRSGILVRIVVGVVVVVLLVVGAVTLLGRNNGTDYSKLKVGDCFDSSKSNQVRGIKVKSCAQSHDSEVFLLVTQPAGPKEAYPGKDALVQFAADACLGQPLTDYIGRPLEQSKYKDFEIVPQDSAWKDGRRVLVCGIDTGGQGPVKGSAKVAKPAS